MRLLGSAAAVVFLLSIAVGTASAGRLSLSGLSYRIAWANLELRSGTTTTSCPVTLEGSFHSTTIRKTAGALMGYITRGTVSSECEGGSATVNQEALPWHLRYRNFRGLLPALTALDLSVVGAMFTVNAGGIVCSAQTTSANPAILVANRKTETGVISGLTMDESATIALRGSFFCGLAGNARLAGRGVLCNITQVTLRLI